jgi:hypothetical protein
MVSDFLQEYTRLWWSCDRSFPSFRSVATLKDQAENEKKMEKLVNGLVYELKNTPRSAEERLAWQERLRPGFREFAGVVLHLQPSQLDFIESSGMLDANIEFSRMARKFDPGITGDDIYQAGRNVMTVNFFQLLLGLPVVVTPSIFAYSMLYPYTDNYLDDPTISKATKQSFNKRFLDRLQGKTAQLENSQEKTIDNLIQMIEGQWDRSQYPQVYESLLAIHAAQGSSLSLTLPGASPFELDVLGISFEKGGTSVLADGYLAAGSLTPEQAKVLYGYGTFTQLIDDLEDVEMDFRDGRMTVFSQTATHWPLDGLTNRLFSFGREILGDLTAFHSPAVPALAELISHSIDPILIDTVGKAGKYFSKGYLHKIEQHFSFRFGFLRQQREKLSRQKIDFSKLIDALN